MQSELHCGSHRLALSRPLIMGIINATPDSFSGDGLALDVGRALAQARTFVEDGADILDIGGESTRPGATPVEVEEEIRRVVPLIEALRELDVPLSIDSFKPQVMRAALRAGATLINDINALRAPGALELAAASDAAVCLMHMQGTPQTMQDNPAYQDVVAEVGAFLATRSAACRAAGIAPERIVIDPGFGFGKTPEHNLQLLQGLDRLVASGHPVLVGLSRKSLLGKLTGRKVSERVAASVAAAIAAVAHGAAIVRVHDVAATRDALAVWCVATQSKS
jgi:dihydropteroate synthase